MPLKYLMLTVKFVPGLARTNLIDSVFASLNLECTHQSRHIVGCNFSMPIKNISFWLCFTIYCYWHISHTENLHTCCAQLYDFPWWHKTEVCIVKPEALQTHRLTEKCNLAACNMRHILALYSFFIVVYSMLFVIFNQYTSIIKD